MSKSVYFRARIDHETKTEGDRILKEVGIKPSQALNMMYKSIIRERGFICDMKMPNAETIKALENCREGKNLTHCKDFDEFCQMLDDA